MPISLEPVAILLQSRLRLALNKRGWELLGLLPFYGNGLNTRALNRCLSSGLHLLDGLISVVLRDVDSCRAAVDAVATTALGVVCL